MVGNAWLARPGLGQNSHSLWNLGLWLSSKAAFKA